MQVVLDKFEHRLWGRFARKMLEYVDRLVRQKELDVESLLAILSLLQTSSRLDNDIVIEVIIALIYSRSWKYSTTSRCRNKSKNSCTTPASK